MTMTINGTPKRGRTSRTRPENVEMLKEVAIILSDGVARSATDIAAQLSVPVDPGKLSPKLVYLTGPASEPLRVSVGLTGHKGDGTAYGAVVRIGPSTYQWLAQARWLDANLVKLPRGMTQKEGMTIASNVTSYSPWYEGRNGKIILPSQELAMERARRRQISDIDTREDPRRGATIAYRLAHGYYAPDKVPDIPHVLEHDVPAEVLAGWNLPLWKKTLVPAWGEQLMDGIRKATKEPEPIPEPEPATIIVTHEAPPAPAAEVELVAVDSHIGGTLVMKLPNGSTVVATINSIIR
jgi:hypothetical protein